MTNSQRRSGFTLVAGSGYLLSRQLQHCLQSRPAQHFDELLNYHLALLDYLDHRQQRRAQFDLQWKVALRIEIDERPFAKGTLQLFRAQFLIHNRAQALFEASIG